MAVVVQAVVLAELCTLGTVAADAAQADADEGLGAVALRLRANADSRNRQGDHGAAGLR